MLDFLKTTRRALPLALALMGSVGAAQAVPVYATEARLLTVPAVNVPGEGSYEAQLILEGGDAELRTGRILKVTQLMSAGNPINLPVSYLFNDPMITMPALAVKSPDGRVSYFDVTLRNISNGGPLTFIVANMVDTAIGKSANKGDAGLQGLAGPAGGTGPAGSAGPVGPAGATGSPGPAGLIGPVGATGAEGVAGATGSAGPAGTAGATGLTGPAGVAGPVGPAGSGGMVGSSSSYNAVLTTALGGLVGNSAILPLNGYVSTAPVAASLLNFNIAGEAYAMAQPFPKAMTLTQIQATIGLKVALALIGSTETISATLYTVAAGSSTPVSTALSCNLNPALTGILAVGTQASCSGAASVSVNAGDQGFFVFSATAAGLSLVNTLNLSAAASVY